MLTPLLAYISSPSVSKRPFEQTLYVFPRLISQSSFCHLLNHRLARTTGFQMENTTQILIDPARRLQMVAGDHHVVPMRSGLLVMTSFSEFPLSYGLGILPLRRAFGADGAEEGGAEIPVATVRQDNNDRSGVHLLSYLHGADDCRATGHANKNPFLRRQQPCSLKSLAIFHDHFSSKPLGS